jgi:hypothetical protein
MTSDANHVDEKIDDFCKKGGCDGDGDDYPNKKTKREGQCYNNSNDNNNNDNNNDNAAAGIFDCNNDGHNINNDEEAATTTTTTDNIEIWWVDNFADAACACNRLQSLRVVGLDMEGCSLGRNGTTSLLQLSASAHEVYIFDVLRLGPELFSVYLGPLILSNPHILKLCYDCRSDADALFHKHRVLAFGLYDLQIVYTALFQSAKDPFLKGMLKALQSPGVLHPDEAAAMLRRKLANKKEWSQNRFDAVLQRPLAPDFVRYCATDVAYLFRMHQLWSPRVPERHILETTHQRMQRFIYRTPSQVLLSQKGRTMSRLDFFCRLPHLLRAM